MQLSLNTRRHDEGTTVTVAGEVDPGSAGALLEHALAVMGEQGPQLAVDLAEVTFMDSGGVEVLLAINDHAQLRGGQLRLVCVPPRVQWLLQIIGVEAALCSATSR
jgi:anti-anti-sigma factor